MEGVVESSEYFNTIEDLINKCSVISITIIIG